MRLHAAHGRAPSGRWRRRTGSVPWARKTWSISPSPPTCLAVPDDHLEYLKRAHRAYQNAGDLPRAARCVFWAGIKLRNARPGQATRPAGSDAHSVSPTADRATTLSTVTSCCSPRCCSARASATGRAWLQLQRKAERIAERHDDADLFALAAHERGNAMVRLGRVEEGLRLWDEIMVSVTAGELSPVVTGLVYCSVIAYCQDVFQVGRAQAWTQALTGWCEQQPEMVAHVGQCLIHRSEILHLRGQWSAALTEARRVITRIAQSKNSPVTGHALYREGEVYRLQGRFDRAESPRTGRPRGLVTSRSPDLRCCALAQGKTTTAVSTIRRALAESNDSVRRARLLPACLEICLANRDLEQAQQACDELEDSREGPQKWVAQRARWPSRAARWNWRQGKPRRGPRKTAARARRVAATRSAVRSCASACSDRTGLPDVGRQRGRGAGVERSSQCVLPPARHVRTSLAWTGSPAGLCPGQSMG